MVVGGGAGGCSTAAKFSAKLGQGKVAVIEPNEVRTDKTGVINDPLGQTHSHASSEHCVLLFCFSRFEKWGRTDGQTCAKTMIPTGRDFGLAEWININFQTISIALKILF